VFTIILKFLNDIASGTAIGDPLSKPKGVELFDILPRRILVCPGFPVTGILRPRVQIPVAYPSLITFRIIDSKDLTILLRPRFRLIPGVIVVLWIASTLECAVDDDV
jgi:hypothetical protein